MVTDAEAEVPVYAPPPIPVHPLNRYCVPAPPFAVVGVTLKDTVVPGLYHPFPLVAP